MNLKKYHRYIQEIKYIFIACSQQLCIRSCHNSFNYLPFFRRFDNYFDIGYNMVVHKVKTYVLHIIQRNRKRLCLWKLKNLIERYVLLFLKVI